MILQGWAEEVWRAVACGHGEDLRCIRPLGYVPWMEGGDPLEIEARIIRETQAYAKRQDTWFRNQLEEVPVWDPDAEPVLIALERLSVPAP
jgi:tRNA dimethylallyltransferase